MLTIVMYWIKGRMAYVYLVYTVLQYLCFFFNISTAYVFYQPNPKDIQVNGLATHVALRDPI